MGDDWLNPGQWLSLDGRFNPNRGVSCKGPFSGSHFLLLNVASIPKGVFLEKTSHGFLDPTRKL